MKSYEEFLEETIPTTPPLSRKEYYRIYVPKGDIKYLYDFIVNNYKS